MQIYYPNKLPLVIPFTTDLLSSLFAFSYDCVSTPSPSQDQSIMCTEIQWKVEKADLSVYIMTEQRVTCSLLSQNPLFQFSS